jgi:hypothetical protein
VIYETQFEAPLFTNGYTLDGQDSWVALPDTELHTSQVVTDLLPGLGQNAILGFLAPDSNTVVSTSVFRPLNVDPVAQGKPLVVMSVTMAIEDSTTTDRDTFRWVVYNRQNGGERLVAVEFDNGTTEIFFLTDDGTFHPTQTTFLNGHVYDLVLLLNLASNVWSATLNGELIVNAAPITTQSRVLDLGDVDAAWVLGPDSTQFGDNYMIFDNFKVQADVAVPLPCRVEPIDFLADGSFLLQLFGEPGRAYAVEASFDLVGWEPLGTNTPTGGSFVFLDSEAPDFPHSFYRGRAVWP